MPTIASRREKWFAGTINNTCVYMISKLPKMEGGALIRARWWAGLGH